MSFIKSTKNPKIHHFIKSIKSNNKMPKSMPNKTSIRVVKSPVMVVVSGLFVASKIVSFDSGQVKVWNESTTDFFSVFEQNVNTVVMSQEVSQS